MQLEDIPEFEGMTQEQKLQQLFHMAQEHCNGLARIVFLLQQEEVGFDVGFDIDNPKTKNTDKYSYKIFVKGGKESCLVL